MSASSAPSLGTPSPLRSSMIERRPVVADAHFDITAMVDLVFMMNIFFLVTWVVAGLEEIDLPAAKTVVASDPDDCVLITIIPGLKAHADVFLGPEKELVDEYRIEETVLQAVENGMSSGKKFVLLKAARNVTLHDLSAIAAVVSTVEGATLRVAVLEKD
jgi:biopolymer transport protein ExbD